MKKVEHMFYVDRAIGVFRKLLASRSFQCSAVMSNIVLTVQVFNVTTLHCNDQVSRTVRLLDLHKVLVFHFFMCHPMYVVCAWWH